MIIQDYTSWLVAIVISLTLHAGLLMQAGAQLGVEDTIASSTPLTTRLNFHSEPRPQPVEVARPKPVMPKPEPVKPKPVEQKKVIPPEHEPVPHRVSQPPPKGQLSNAVDALLLKQQQQMYIQQLLAHIENHKYYPHAARRRGIEGSINISFMLLANGQVRQLQVTGGPNVLQHATREAMEQAQPLPLPPSGISLPRQIAIAMVYSLH